MSKIPLFCIIFHPMNRNKRILEKTPWHFSRFHGQMNQKWRHTEWCSDLRLWRPCHEPDLRWTVLLGLHGVSLPDCSCTSSATRRTCTWTVRGSLKTTKRVFNRYLVIALCWVWGITRCTGWKQVCKPNLSLWDGRKETQWPTPFGFKI